MVERFDLEPWGDAIDWLEARLAELGLKSKTYALAKFAGATHWHISNPARRERSRRRGGPRKTCSG